MISFRIGRIWEAVIELAVFLTAMAVVGASLGAIAAMLTWPFMGTPLPAKSLMEWGTVLYPLAAFLSGFIDSRGETFWQNLAFAADRWHMLSPVVWAVCLYKLGLGVQKFLDRVNREMRGEA